MYTRSQNTNRKLENKNIKNMRQWCNQDPKAEACTNMGPEKFRLDKQ